MRRSTLAPTNKTFYLARPSDYFDKLTWEVAQLHALPRDYDRERAYQAMNCAITAWHMSEWVYAAMTDEQRATRTDGKATKGGYQNWLRAQTSALHVCRQLATASKHGRVTEHDDDSIYTDHLSMPVPGRPNKRFSSEPAIYVSGYRWIPEQVLTLVVDFWRDELTRLGMIRTNQATEP